MYYRIALAPAYSFALCLVYRNLTHKGHLWMAIYVIAVVLTLVPAHLFELRYFVPACVIAVLHVKNVLLLVFTATINFVLGHTIKSRSSISV